MMIIMVNNYINSHFYLKIAKYEPNVIDANNAQIIPLIFVDVDVLLFKLSANINVIDPKHTIIVRIVLKSIVSLTKK